MFLDRIEKYAPSLDDTQRQAPGVAGELASIAADRDAHGRYMEFARDADQPVVRARMLGVARNLGWLTQDEQRAELGRMIGELLAANAVTPAEVDLVCTLDKEHDLDPVRRSCRRRRQTPIRSRRRQ